MRERSLDLVKIEDVKRVLKDKAIEKLQDKFEIEKSLTVVYGKPVTHYFRNIILSPNYSIREICKDDKGLISPSMDRLLISKNKFNGDDIVVGRVISMKMNKHVLSVQLQSNCIYKFDTVKNDIMIGNHDCTLTELVYHLLKRSQVDAMHDLVEILKDEDAQRISL